MYAIIATIRDTDTLSQVTDLDTESPMRNDNVNHHRVLINVKMHMQIGRPYSVRQEYDVVHTCNWQPFSTPHWTQACHLKVDIVC